MARIISVITLDDDATGLQTGTVGEPAVASSGGRILVTGNWYASRSTDGGQTWRFIDPFTEFPPVAGGLCCDQVVHYSRTHRVWIWVLQYSAADRTNSFRIAASASGVPGTWKWWDIAPADVDPSWNELWFDYPDLAQSDEHLYVSFNMFDRFDRWQRATVLRFPLDEITARGELAHEAWTTTELGSIRFVQGADDEMWFASHAPGNDAVVLQAWRDDRSDATAWDIPIDPWNDLSYTSSPAAGEWLGRIDGRITAAWRGNGQLGLAWTAAPQPDRPHPFIRVVRIDEQTLAVVDQPDLWSQSGAYAYPAASPNRRGDVGMAAFFAGPTHPAHVVAAFDDDAAQWHVTTVATSTHPPRRAVWGDYLTVRPDPRRLTYWMASGYSLEGGNDRRNIEPLVVTFAP